RRSAATPPLPLTTMLQVFVLPAIFVDPEPCTATLADESHARAVASTEPEPETAPVSPAARGTFASSEPLPAMPSSTESVFSKLAVIATRIGPPRQTL